jgi:HD-like signal output (HDOD) protein
MHPEWGKDGKLKVSPNDLLKYALRTEELVAGNKEGYSETAFAAGLMFDALQMVASEVAANDDRKKVSAYIDTVYQHGLRSAQIGMELGRLIPDFTYKKYIFSTCLIHDVGKIMLAALNPAYLTFVDECGKKEVPRAVRFFAEEKRFGINHAMLSAISCRSFKMFRNVERAVLFHHDPYLLKNSNRNMHQLAQLVCLASNIANNFKKTDKLDDPMLARWRGAELKDFRIDLKTIAQAVSKMP